MFFSLPSLSIPLWGLEATCSHTRMRVKNCWDFSLSSSFRLHLLSYFYCCTHSAQSTGKGIRLGAEKKRGQTVTNLRYYLLEEKSSAARVFPVGPKGDSRCKCCTHSNARLSIKTKAHCESWEITTKSRRYYWRGHWIAGGTNFAINPPRARQRPPTNSCASTPFSHDILISFNQSRPSGLEEIRRIFRELRCCYVRA